MSSKLRMTLLACCAALPPWATAGRPLVTEDSGVLANKACELESVLGRQSERGAPRLRFGSVQLGCGIGWDTQIALGAGRESQAGERGTRVGLAGKTMLRDGGDAGASVALAWGAEAIDGPGIRMRLESLYATGVGTLRLSNALAMHANLGWSRSRSQRASTTGWALAVERSGEAGMDVMGEVFGDDRDHHPWVQVGVRTSVLPERLWVDASAGVQTSPQRPKALTVGVKLAF
jgi:hypothetical protein